MKTATFEQQLSQRLEENQILSQTGLPSWTAPLTSILGRELWKGLLFISFGLTAAWFVFDSLSLMRFVRLILIMK